MARRGVTECQPTWECSSWRLIRFNYCVPGLLGIKTLGQIWSSPGVEHFVSTFAHMYSIPTEEENGEQGIWGVEQVRSAAAASR